MSLSTPFIRTAGGHHAADHGHRTLRRGRVSVSRRSRRCRKSIFRPFRSTPRLPGASPETMASSVATPLERQFGHIAGVNEMTSSSSLGSTSITLQFDLSRNIDAAARDVQAAINAARSQLPASAAAESVLAQKQSRRLADSVPRAHFRHHAARATCTTSPSTILQQKIAQVKGVAQVVRAGQFAAGRPHRRESDAAE